MSNWATADVEPVCNAFAGLWLADNGGGPCGSGGWPGPAGGFGAGEWGGCGASGGGAGVGGGGGGMGGLGGGGGGGLVSRWAVRVVAGSPGDHHWPWAHQSQQFEIQYCSATRVVPQSAEDWSWVYQSRSPGHYLPQFQ